MKTALRVLAIMYLVYLGLSALVVIPLLNFLPPWFVQQQYQRDLSTELVVFNPFTLSLEVRDASLKEPNGEDFAGFDQLRINLSTSGLWRTGWVFDEFVLEGIDMHLQRLPAGNLNIDDLLQAPGDSEPEPQSDSPGEAPGVTIDFISLSAHRIRVTDAARPTPYTTHWDDLQVRMSDLSTVVEAGHPYHLRVHDESGGSLEWTGELSVPGARSSGSIELSGIALKPFWRYVKDQVDFELHDGRLHLQAEYAVDWSEELVFRIDKGELDVAQLELKPRDAEQLSDTAVEFAVLRFDDIAIDSTSETVNIQQVSLDGLKIAGWLEGERISLAEMFNTRFENSTDEEPEEPANWQLALQNAALKSAEIRWRSAFTEPETLQIAPLNITAESIHWPATGSSPISVDFLVNEELAGKVQAALNIATGDGDLAFDIQRIPIPWFAPNVPEVLNARIDTGLAKASGELSLLAFAPQQVTLEGAVQDFSMRMYEADESITRWNVLEWQGLKVDLPGQRVDLAQLHLDGYAGRIHIREDGSLNVQRLLREDAQAKEAAAQASDEPAAEEGEATPWGFGAPAIYISDSQVDFMDESLPIHFRTIIGDVNGEIIGLDSDPAQSLDVDIKGSVDGYAPVVLKGSASPLRSPPALDLNLTFRGVDLARLTPYSGTYAGYAIDRGTLNLDLKYSLAEDRLQGDNKVIIDQLKLGEKIDSDKALDIPLQLGIALLTDASGVIDLAVPVSGDVNDPQFGLGSVIFGAFVNLITKAITAPFSLLANLVGSDDDLQRINFPAGSSELDQQAQKKMLELSEALQERPQLKLVIGGRLDPETDRVKLQQQLLREALLAEGLTEAEIDGRGEDWAAAIASRYRALPVPGTAADAPEPSPTVQARKVREQFTVPAAALKALAEDRAASTKRFLVNEGQMAAERAVIEQTDPLAESNTFSGVEMSVDT